jgi:hypothetical protein
MGLVRADDKDASGCVLSVKQRSANYRVSHHCLQAHWMGRASGAVNAQVQHLLGVGEQIERRVFLGSCKRGRCFKEKSRECNSCEPFTGAGSHAISAPPFV